MNRFSPVHPFMNRVSLLLLLALIWAVIYLPGLGGGELKGEEGRRILPGLTMLENGNWILPYMNGEPYLRKPPLINWAIAASTVVTGVRNEWSVRLPSVLAVLAATLVIAGCTSRWLGLKGGWLAGLFYLTAIAMLEKGRLAEIEALYVSLTAVAFALWIAAWVQREGGWRLWLVPTLMLALGILVKGPVPHLLFFYGIIFCVLAAAGEKRALLAPAHFVGLLLGAVLVALWWLPYQSATAELGAKEVMLNEVSARIGGGRFDPLNVPRALANGLPWILLLPLWWNRRVVDAVAAANGRWALLLRATRWPLILLFAASMLLKGMLPRYTLPLYPAMAILLALVALHAPLSWRKLWLCVNRGVSCLLLAAFLALPWAVAPAQPGPARWIGVALAWLALAAVAVYFWRHREERVEALAAGMAICLGAGVIAYALALTPRISLEDHLRPVGTVVAQEVPAGEELFIIDPGYEPALFYVRPPFTFVSSPRNLPSHARFVLCREGDMERLRKRRKERFESVALHKEGKKPFFLLKLFPESETTPRPDPSRK